jgi:signal peptidase II
MATRWFVLLSIILAGADQLTKSVALKGLQPNVRYEIVPDFFRLTLNFNKGIAWGMLPEWSEYFTYFAIIMVLVILMILRKLDKDEVWLKIALAFQMAGAIGNMTDRIARHQVTDFLDVTLFPHVNPPVNYAWNLGLLHGRIMLPYDWPIFNLADSFVVVGTIVLVMVLMFSRETSIVLGEVKSAPVRGGLGAADDQSMWIGAPVCQGNVPMEEALIELPEIESEGLVPLEEVESVRQEKIADPLGQASESTESVPIEDKDKLNELSNRPER